MKQTSIDCNSEYEDAWSGFHANNYVTVWSPGRPDQWLHHSSLQSGGAGGC